MSAWDAFVPIDLTSLFTGKGPLPAVVEVFGQDGRWDVVGRSRSVRLSDGSELREEITSVQNPDGRSAQFAYVVTGFSGLIGVVTDQATGEWSFTRNGEQTLIIWTYNFRPRGFLAAMPLMLIVRVLWSTYMRDALRRTVRILEAQRPDSS